MSPAEFEDVYRRCAPLVHSRVRRILGTDAEDVVQEVFARLWRRPPQHGELTAWLYRTSTNACIDRLRASGRRDARWRGEVNSADRATPTIEEALASKDLCRRLLVKADDRTREIVTLVYFDELTQEDAATVLGITRKTVGERMDRFHDLARKAMRRWQT